MSTDALPIPTHLASEFYAWVWWSSEQRGGHFDLGENLGPVDLWVDDRIAFRNPDAQKVAAVLTGENPSTTLEARAALAGGKVLQDIRIGIRRDDREFTTTLKGPSMSLQSTRLPQEVMGGGEEALLDRMHLYDELCAIVTALFRQWASLRVSAAWDDDILPELRAWVAGQA